MKLQSFKFKAMGSPCEIRLYASTENKATDAILKAVGEVHRLEEKYSRFLKNNFMDQLNRAAKRGEKFSIDAETYQILLLADQCWQQSEGLFDISSGVLRKIWDFEKNTIPNDQDIENILLAVGWDKVKLSEDSVRFCQPNMEIDLGGLVKEYAVDRAAMVCRNNGIESGMVDLGGDIFVLGPQPDGQAWKIHIRHPRIKDQYFASFEVEQGGLASSGDYERFIDIDGQRYCHIFSPKTGWPIKQGLAAVSVQAERCVLAGSIASMAMLKEQQSKTWLQSLGVHHVWMDVNQNIGGSAKL